MQSHSSCEKVELHATSLPRASSPQQFRTFSQRYEEGLKKLAKARGGERKHSTKVDDRVKDLNDRIAELQNEKEELLTQSREAAASGTTGVANSQPRQKFRIYDVRPMK